MGASYYGKCIIPAFGDKGMNYLATLLERIESGRNDMPDDRFSIRDWPSEVLPAGS